MASEKQKMADFIEREFPTSGKPPNYTYLLERLSLAAHFNAIPVDQAARYRLAILEDMKKRFNIKGEAYDRFDALLLGPPQPSSGSSAPESQ